MIYFGGIFTLFWMLVDFHILRLFFKLKYEKYFISILFVLLFVFSIFNANFVPVKKVEIETDKIDDFRIVQISDLHLGAIYNGVFLKKVVDRINTLDPDVVFITGDLFDSAPEGSYEMIDEINNIDAETFFILGNHEVYVGKENVIETIEKTKVKLLVDESVYFEDLQIIGVEDAGHGNGKNVEDVLDNISFNSSKFVVFLTHQPVKFSKFKDYPIDLEMAGHTHAGQIFPFNLIVWFFYPNIKGLYSEDGQHIYVSPGTGTWGPPMRLGSKNEITVVDLKAFSQK